MSIKSLTADLLPWRPRTPRTWGRTGEKIESEEVVDWVLQTMAERNRPSNKTLKDMSGLIASLLNENVLKHFSTCEWMTDRQTQIHGYRRRVWWLRSPAGIQRRSTLNVGQLSNWALFSTKYRQDRSRLSWQLWQKAVKINYNVRLCVRREKTVTCNVSKDPCLASALKYLIIHRQENTLCIIFQWDSVISVSCE